jgi:LysR family cyn operon transcriptional activator
MPLEVLRHVLLIAEHGSILAAAQTVNLTGSSLSRKITQLEHELGLELFERHSRGMRPTDAGALLIEAARQMLARMERLASDIDDIGAMGRGSVRLFTSQALIEHIVMPRVLQMGAKYPHVKIDLQVAVGRLVERALLSDGADFAVITTVPTHPDIEIVAKRENRVVAIVNRAHEFASLRRIEAGVLAASPFAALPNTYNSRVAFNALLPDAMKSVQPQMTVNSVAALKAYALSGLGAAIVPELALSATDTDLVVLTLEHADQTDTRMCLCRRKSHIMGSAASRLLDEFAQSFADDDLA